MKAPDKDSKRSKKRANRGFKSLIQSSRKHRRAERRASINQTIGANHHGSGGTRYEPGKTVDPPLQGKQKTFVQRVSGKQEYY